MSLCYLSQMCEAPHLNMHGQLPSGARCIHFGLSQGCSLTMYEQLPSGARCLNIDMNLYLHHSLYVWAGMDCDDIVNMLSHIWALAIRRFNKNQKTKTNWPFLYKAGIFCRQHLHSLIRVTVTCTHKIWIW